MLDEHALVPRSPVEVDLSSRGVVGIVGDRTMALALGRSLVCQAAVHHGPADLSVAVFGGDDWDWTKWLPHLERDAATLAASRISGKTREIVRIIFMTKLG